VKPKPFIKGFHVEQVQEENGENFITQVLKNGHWNGDDEVVAT